AYDDALRFGEHTWGFNEHIEDYEETFKTNQEKGKYETIEESWEEKLSLANNIQNEVEPVLRKNMKTLTQNVKSDKQRIVVYNSLPWERSGKVEVEFNGEKPESLINSETQEVVAVDSISDGYLT
ncbi:hypothetical protein, partial [Clostridium perfringens]|uniref:hypothetical protein n=1 Tax=Clostridium perfringens TaxID=1502 RepID=UPI002ACC0CAC